MKFTIDGFSQSKLIEFELDSRDATFLRWFIDFQATGKMKQHDFDGRLHYWIGQSHLAEDMPILGLKDSNSVRRYLARLCEKNVLSRHNIARGNGDTMQGSSAYYAINGDMLDSLINDHRHEYTDGQGRPPAWPYRSDPSTIDSSRRIEAPSDDGPPASSKTSEFRKFTKKLTELHEKATGEKYLYDSTQGKLVKDILKLCGLTIAIGKLERFYTDKDLFFTKNGGYDLKNFRANINKLRVKKHVVSNRRYCPNKQCRQHGVAEPTTADTCHICNTVLLRVEIQAS